MGIYLITLTTACLLAYQTERTGWTDKYGKAHYNTKFLVALIVFLCVVSGFRYMNYYASDEYNYRVMVDGMRGLSFSSCVSLMSEWLSQAICWVAANVFKTSQFLILFAAVVTNVSFILFFVKHAESLWFVVFMYIAGGAYFTSMNVLRQYMAVGVLVWCIDFAKDRKLIKYLLLVVIAAGIHQSAWLMSLMYFVLRRKKLDWMAAVIIAGTIVLFLNFQGVMETFLSAGTVYDHYLENILSGGYGVKIIRIVAWLVPYGLLLWKYQYCEERLKIESQTLFCVMMSACISVVSHQYVFFARIGDYFAVPALCGVIRVPELFTADSERIVKIAMVVLFFLFGCYQMSSSAPYHNILFENISGTLYL